MAAAKARLGASDRASPSPYLTGDDSDTESLSGKRKSESMHEACAAPLTAASLPTLTSCAVCHISCALVVDFMAILITSYHHGVIQLLAPFIHTTLHISLAVLLVSYQIRADIAELLNGNGKRASSPSKAALAKKARLAQPHSGSAPPSSRAPHPPSRLGRPPTSAKSASPYAVSPEKSGAASAPTWREGSAASATSTGTTGKKTLPSAAPPIVPQGDGDESSEADDDY